MCTELFIISKLNEDILLKLKFVIICIKPFKQLTVLFYNIVYQTILLKFFMRHND